MNHIKGVIFDLDGTLVSCDLCFTAMKEAISCPLEQDILSFVDTLTEGEKEHAERIIEQLELNDAQNAKWIHGAKRFIDVLHQLKLPTAIITRNSRVASQIKKDNNQIPIDTVITREDAPAKPDPTALLGLSERWGISPQNLLYIGDYLYDINVAKNAGVNSALLCESSIPEYAKDADYVFTHYQELEVLFQKSST